MCTVTFIAKANGDFILTSNRDEATDRTTLPPKKYLEDRMALVYPKDALAGGTWIGISEQKRLVCLLNGGFEAHVRKKSYRKSRGLVVKELLLTAEAKSFLAGYDFSGIEPFTSILVDWQENVQLTEVVWDGDKLHQVVLDNTPHIWSSSLLYTQSMKAMRRDWFASFIKEHKNPDAQALLNFHQTAGIGNRDVDLQIDRGFLKTVSITQVIKQRGTVTMFYKDLQTGKEKEASL